MKDKKNLKKLKIILIVIKKHENVFKNWLHPNFLLLPEKRGLENLGQPPFDPLARTPPLTKLNIGRLNVHELF